MAIYKTIRDFMLAATILISGCAQPYVMQTTFDPSEAHWSQEAGNSSVKGQAFLTTRGGDVKTCAGRQVFLLPATQYFREMATASQNPHVSSIANPDNSVRGFGKATRCDAQGSFAFEHLPVGDWIVMTEVRWQVFNGDYTLNEGGVVTEDVATTVNEQAAVVVTR